MKSTLRRTWAEVDLDALSHNFEVIRARVAPGTALLGVVKANAYGHGAVRVAERLERLGAGYLAVSNIDECAELRAHGIALPVLMLGYTPPDQTERILGLDMTQTVPSLSAAEAYSAAAVRAGGRMRVHIKLDTGMSRLGFPCGDGDFERSLAEILAVLRLPGLDVEGVFTHFSVSDERAEDSVRFTRMQHDRFLRMVGAVEARGGFRFRIKHCCNSGGIANYPEWAGDMVRCGIILYGAGELAEELGMRPVMTLKTTVSAVETLPAGTPVGYGRTFQTARPSRIAVLPIGYADGLHRALSNRLEVLTPGGRARGVGRICMDMCMIDVTDLPEARVGDEVEVFGARLPVEETAERCGTISYELLCAVSGRVPRVYLSDGKREG